MSTAPPPDRWPLDRHPAIGAQLGASDPARAFLYDQIASLAPPPPQSIPVQLLTTLHEAARVAALAMPKLFIVGENDPIFPPDVIRDAASMTAKSRVVVVPDTGHSPYFEKPELWNDAVLAFFDEVEGVEPG
jgi:pimeloyl-ACP methyl ester carboxylesterase